MTKFVSHEYRITEFEKMIHYISQRCQLSCSLVRQMGERALNRWESTQHRNVLSLFIGQPDERFVEISKMLDYFRNYLEDLVPSEKRLNESLNVAASTLNRMYQLF